MPRNKTNETLNVLVVDDSLADRLVLERALETVDTPLSVEFADNGEEALDRLFQRGKFKGHRLPDACLVDLKMPGVSGLDVLRLVKSDKIRCRMPITIISSSDREQDVVDCYSSFASGYVQKPLQFEDLLEKVSTLVDMWTKVYELPSAA